MGEYLESHLASAFDLRASSRYQYERDYEVHVKPFIGHIRLVDLTTDDLRRYFARLEAEGRTANAITAARRVLGRGLTAALKEGLIDRNPLAPIPWHKAPRREVQPLTPEQVDDIAGAIYPRWRAVVYVAAYGGLRIGEVGGLKVDDVDLAKGKVTVRRTVANSGGIHIHDPKTAAGRRSVTLPAFVVDQVREHMRTWPPVKGFVFTTRSGGHLHSGAINREFRAACREAGLEGVHFHDLRHTAASFAIERGAHPKVVSARLGHANIGITMDTYGHLFPGQDEDLAAALDGLGRREA